MTPKRNFGLYIQESLSSLSNCLAMFNYLVIIHMIYKNYTKEYNIVEQIISGTSFLVRFIRKAPWITLRKNGKENIYIYHT